MRGNKTWHKQVRTLEPALFRQLPASFQVTQQALRDCLVKHSIAIRGELVARPLSTTQAADRRDALVKVRSGGRWRAGQRGPLASPALPAPAR